MGSIQNFRWFYYYEIPILQFIPFIDTSIDFVNPEDTTHAVAHVEISCHSVYTTYYLEFAYSLPFVDVLHLGILSGTIL